MAFTRGPAMLVCLALCWSTCRLAAGEEKELFNGKDLTNFTEGKGKWKVVDGAIVNELDPAAASRLETTASFGDFEMTCKLMYENTRNGELQIHSYGQVFALHLEPGAWVEVKVVAKGADVKLTVAGQAVEFDKNDGKPDQKEGVIGFCAPKGGTLKIKDVKIKK